MEAIGVEVFEKLMPKRIKSVLLVASLYDSFLFADDDMLSEVLFEHNLTNREHFVITRAKNPEEAIEFVNNGNYDIVISMMQSIEFDMEKFVNELKNRKDIPVVLLSFSISDINILPEKTLNMLDGVFLWQGDTSIFSSIINLIEDKINLKHDLNYGVQWVLLVEDNIRFYSRYLPIIYRELIKQMHIVMSDELNISRKVLRMKARPKIFLARNYEQAWEMFEKYHNNLLGVITDVEYPIKEKTSEKAGLLLAVRVKKKISDMPVLIQSSNSSYEPIALKVGASFLNKNSPDISKQLRGFIQRYFGFGDFVFDDGKGNEIARAADLPSMIKVLKVIPESSIIYHASRNHFSKWLLARTEFAIAYKIKPKKIEEFKNPLEIRNYLIETMHQFMYKTQLGSILKFDKNKYDVDTPFAKIGNGSIGGKARGVAFIDYLIGKGVIKENINGINIKTPPSVVVATDVFDFFIEQNNLSQFLDGKYSDEELAKIFENVNLPDYAIKDIMYVISKRRGPLALRSSSLLEDSKNYPFAGIYRTYMYSNDQKIYDDFKIVDRLIKYIYASTFSKDAVEFRRSNPTIPGEEKMAVIIQSVVGREYIKGYYFPLISGVLQSYNFYPVYPLKHDDVVVHLALGLGEIIMSGKSFLRYSPSNPQVIHQFSTIEDIVKTTQKKFLAIKKDAPGEVCYNKSSSVVEVDIEGLELSEEMKALFSSYIYSDDRLVDYYDEKGLNLLTFFPVIKNNIIPLNETLVEISKKCVDAMGGNVEIEFALDWDIKTSTIDLYLLQIRYFAGKFPVHKTNFSKEGKKRIVYSKSVVGNSYLKDIRDIVFVKRSEFNNLKTTDIAKEISEINSICRERGSCYILIGPGRWGTSDIHLGIPVKWSDISMAKVIIECVYESFNITPSYGTHFFHNIVAMSIAYFHLDEKDSEINWDIIENAPVIMERKYVKWIRFENPLEVMVDPEEGYIVL